MTRERSEQDLTTSPIAARLKAVRQRIHSAAQRAGRAPGDVTLVAVSKTQPLTALECALAAGQTRFGESYVQEAVKKITALGRDAVEWHFVGVLQANKTRAVAAHFHWVHSVDRLKTARRLNDQRPAELPPLNVCLQVNIGGESQKAGIGPAELAGLAAAVDEELPRLRLRGLMALPPRTSNPDAQREHFRRVRHLQEQLIARGHPLDTLSMGMSGDLESAITEGATLIRLGTAVFGARPGGRTPTGRPHV
ncbi:MAG TPA: YggS family pyridoxal phosphate-dependent enzyme [Gammaproteobacteria bacterium]|nr:YggS family pyridoxal phosphate-dependent enzyme [Gammaproteobacteria bacterium]